jgi:hypothetical protein
MAWGSTAVEVHLPRPLLGLAGALGHGAEALFELGDS